jgi:Mg2+ and Co2+ transporter CorA
MTSSSDFFDVFFDSQPLLIEDDWHNLETRLFLPDGSLDAFLEAYDLQSGHGSLACGSKSPQQLLDGREAAQLSQHGDGPKLVPTKSTTLPVISDPLPLVTLHTPESAHTFVRNVSRSQVLFVRQRNSYSPLSLSASLYESLVSTRLISPCFINYLKYLGERDSEIEIVPPALRFRFGETTSNNKTGVFLESMMGVRFVELHGRSERSTLSARWSLRQSAIYLRGSKGDVHSTCLFVTPSKALKSRLNKHLPVCSRLDLTCVVELQALILDAAVTSWRPYIIDLTAEADIHAAQVLGATPDDSGPMNMSNASERQSLMILDEKVQNALSALRHTKELLKAVLEECEEMRETEPDLASANISAVFETMLRETDVLLLRLQALQSRLQGVSNIVSSFLELSSGFALQQLTRESRRENEAMRELSERMHHLTEKATRDAAAVKVLTIMTMIYLPATVVSNFFSTSFVRTNDGNDHIVLLGDWWIFVAVSVPLTAITLYIWLVWMRIQAHHVYPWWWLTSKKTMGTKAERPGLGLDEESRGDSLRVKQA